MEYGTYGKEMVEAARKDAACTANRIAGAFGYSREDREDLEQTLILAVLEKAGAFDPARGGIKTFVGTVVRGELLHALRRRRADKWIRAIPCLHDDAFDGEEIVPYHETLDRAVCMDCMRREETDPFLIADLCHDVAVALKLLTPRQRDISRLLMKTDKATAAHRLGISRQTLYREIKAIREVMAESGLDAYMQAV